MIYGGFAPGSDQTKTLKLCLVDTPLNTQHYKSKSEEWLTQNHTTCQ